MTLTPPDIPASSGLRNCLTRARVAAVRIVAANILKTRIEQAIEYALKAASFIICGMEPGPPFARMFGGAYQSRRLAANEARAKGDIQFAIGPRAFSIRQCSVFRFRDHQNCRETDNAASDQIPGGRERIACGMDQPCDDELRSAA